ncbi:MAG: ABC transporter permease, partial [Deltaproteobacteria bacterium]|nr:ABC transporter permease [Deltaproteobacteria bacterium]
MRTVSRYARLLVLQMRMSAVTAMQYRADFILKGAISMVWLSVALIPL